jgi:hypothetical protein
MLKKSFFAIALYLLPNIVYSQIYTFELDTIQVFKCPANLSPNEAVVLNKFEYFDLKKLKRKVWKIDLKKKIFKVGKEIIKITRTDFDLKEKWMYIEFLDPKGKLYKLALANEKGTEKDLIIVLSLGKDLINQNGYFGYPIGLKVQKNKI